MKWKTTPREWIVMRTSSYGEPEYLSIICNATGRQRWTPLWCCAIATTKAWASRYAKKYGGVPTSLAHEERLQYL